MSNNMNIWDSNKKTDPTKTKKVNQRGGYTSIAPQYQLQEATKQFGPYGFGFGFESIELDYSQIELLKLVLVDAVFFYCVDDKRHSFPIKNSWPVMSGSKVDSDFAKKAETNTMSKALSKLGFSADVFMGEFDDPEYVSIIKSEKAIENAENKADEKIKQSKEYQEKCAKEVELIKKCQSLNDLKHTFTEYFRRAGMRSDEAQKTRLTKAKDDKKTQLEGGKNE